MIKSFFIQTYGCAMNEYDSDRIASVLELRGLLKTTDFSSADLVILNTCSVRDKPQRKVNNFIGQVKHSAKRNNKSVKVGVMGCVAQQLGEQLIKSNKKIDFIIGTDALSELNNVLDRVENGERVSYTDWSKEEFSIKDLSHAGKVSELVTIMKGCNNFCSYCIVPYVRGREVSRKPDEIMSEVERAISLGAKEITLLGQNVNSYGIGASFDVDFPKLLSMVASIDGLHRLRFLTSHPKDFNDQLLEVMADNKNICPYIHLPLQSGSDRILKAMNRKYTLADYMSKISSAKKYIPNISFSSDFIVGFPDEAEEDFLLTTDVIKEVKYESIFVFNYSPRPGTKAFSSNDNIPITTKTDRLKKINMIQEQIVQENFSKLLNKQLDILVMAKSIDGVYSGRSINNRVVNFISEKNIAVGDIVDVTITEAKRNSLFGEYR